MPKYELVATMDVGYRAIIEADNDEDAWNKAKNDSTIAWEKQDDGHDWTIEYVFDAD